MKKIITSILLLPTALGYAQLVGINTDSPKAMLHITDLPKDTYRVTNGVIETPRNKAGLKIPTHTTLPVVPYETDEEIALSQAKNGMLIHLNATDHQGFYYWDNNDFSWQNIIDSRDVNLDTSKTIVLAESLTGLLEDTNPESLIFSKIRTFDEDFKLADNNRSIVIGKPAAYYFRLMGGLIKTGQPMGYQLDVKVNGVTKFSTAISAPATANGEKRGANFALAKQTTFKKGDKITVSITATDTKSNTYSEYNSPFTITLIKLN